jgi:hypothetical protein
MKKMWMLLIVLMTCLTLSGCGTWNCPEYEIPPVDTVFHYTECPVDTVPTYNPLDKLNHLGSAENANTLISNLEVAKDYNKSLNTTIECYEKQVPSEKPND